MRYAIWGKQNKVFFGAEGLGFCTSHGAFEGAINIAEKKKTLAIFPSLLSVLKEGLLLRPAFLPAQSSAGTDFTVVILAVRNKNLLWSCVWKLEPLPTGFHSANSVCPPKNLAFQADKAPISPFPLAVRGGESGVSGTKRARERERERAKNSQRPPHTSFTRSRGHTRTCAAIKWKLD